MDQTFLAQSGLSLNIEKVNFWILVLVAVVLAVYSIYAFVVKKQVGILNKSIHTDGAPLLNGLALLHLIFSLLLLAIVILFLLFRA